MFVSQNGLSIPALELKIKWSNFFKDGVVDIAQIKTAAVDFASKVAESKLSTYTDFARGTIVDDQGLFTLVVSEPITLDTSFITPSSGTRYPVATTLFKAPSGNVHRQVSIDGLNKTWYETVLHRYVSTRVAITLTEKLAATKNGRIYASRLQGLRAQEAALIDRLPVCFAPLAIYERNADGLVVSTPGYVWADANARVLMDHTSVTNAVVESVVSTFTEGGDLVRDMIRPKVAEVAKSLSFAVNIDKAMTQTLPNEQKEMLKSLAASFVGMPLLAMDVMSITTRYMDVDAFARGVKAIAALVAGNEEVVDAIDIDASPRSLAELIFLVTGNGRFQYLDSVDAFYRRKELPTLADDVPTSLAQTILTVHPSLVGGAVVIADRTVRYVHENTTYDVVFPDRLGTNYSFTVTEGDAQARAELTKINSFLQASFTFLTGEEGIAPIVLKQLGVKGIQKGASFALN